jgi:hypothetical protein
MSYFDVYMKWLGIHNHKPKNADARCATGWILVVLQENKPSTAYGKFMRWAKKPPKGCGPFDVPTFYRAAHDVREYIPKK